ncbi:hypothetical protein PV326_003925 [Microctonus aethiopoides]|nr:hypothetical protein PV326_003925 [Microctonus aethiopoides]
MAKNLYGLLLLILCVINCQTKIPNYLKECYTNETFSETKLPMNLQVLIDIIRKAEKYSQMSIDLRTMTSSLLHRFKFDGIEYNKNIKLNNGVLPFGDTGMERIKNQITEELVPGNANAFPSNALSLFERCALHRAVSNTIWDQEMPETNKFCENKPTEKISAENISMNNKKLCPLEQGVILTPFGTLAFGTLIAAIAAAIQPQNVAVKLLLNITNEYDFNEDEVDFIMPKSQMDLHKSMWFTSIISSTAELDNVWFATVAGELAELAVYQGPFVGHQMILGVTGFWNNTMRPTRYYLEKDINSDVTRAEIIGAVDGFIIAKNLPLWMSKFNNLRLSQILDIYYSTKGPSFDSRISACERGKSFWYVASRTIMEEQTYTASQILAYRRSIAHMTDDVLMTMTNYAVNKFTNYINNNLFTELRCLDNKNNNHPHVEVFVVFDGAWSLEYTANFLSVLLEDLDVSMFGSKIGFLHGITGEWILNVTESPSLAHQAIVNFTSSSWTTGLNLINSFESVEKYLTHRWNERHKNYTIASLGQVMLILAPLITLNIEEQKRIYPSLKSLKDNHPDLNFIYYTTAENFLSFKQFLHTEEDYLITSSKINDISDYLLTIPRSLRPEMCKKNVTINGQNQFEGYVQPQEIIVYRLDPSWRINTKYVKMKIISVGYGKLELCWWNQYRNSVRKERYMCRELSGHNEIIIHDTFRCDKDIKCPAIFYQIRGISSLKKCAEMDCKTPDHIRYLLRIENLQCSRGEKPLSNIFNISILILLFTLINACQ